MALGIAELILFGLIVDWIVRQVKLPGLIGLLILGIVMGPYYLNSINEQTQLVAGDLRIIALIVILLRAGFELSWQTLRKIGGRAIMMSFIPCILEISVITLFGPTLFGITRLEAAMLGSVLGAVSPAVVVPLMIQFIEEGRGADKGIPTLVLAGASCDDAVAIVLCSSFIGMYVGDTVNIAWKVAGVPVSIITGIALGLGIGVVVYKLFDKFNPRATKRVLMLLGISILLLHIEKHIETSLPFAALIAVMAIGFIILEKREHAAHEISGKLGKIWVFAQLLLFIIVGTQVKVPVAIDAGFKGALIIFLGLCGRSIGTQLCLLKSNLNAKERLFVGLSYLPKATVQAAIGAAPLVAMKTAGMDTGAGELILAIAVLSILITAPTGALAISWGGKNLLNITAHSPDESPAMQAALESEEK
jgi:NhaP-type Na+/H+ or K+/H+ antiporter